MPGTKVDLRSAFIDGAKEVGILVQGGSVTAEHVVVRRTGLASDGFLGYGIAVEENGAVHGHLDAKGHARRLEPQHGHPRLRRGRRGARTGACLEHAVARRRRHWQRRLCRAIEDDGR